MNIIGYLCLASRDNGPPMTIIINPERDILVIERDSIPADLQDVVAEIEKDGQTAVLGLVTDPTGRGAP